jgi:hypothetical protein
MRDHEDALQAQLVEQGKCIVRKRGPAAAGCVSRLSEGSMVEAYAAVLLGEERDLLPPRQVVPSGSVGKQDCRPLAMLS